MAGDATSGAAKNTRMVRGGVANASSPASPAKAAAAADRMLLQRTHDRARARTHAAATSSKQVATFAAREERPPGGAPLAGS